MSHLSACPACLASCGSVLRRLSVNEAAQHFVLREEDPERHNALAECVRGLWGREDCEIVRCGSCAFAYAFPYVAGNSTFYDLAYPRASYPRDRWEYSRTLQALSGARLGRVLEVGAGAGLFLDRLSADRHDVVALDLNAAACAKLRAKGYTAISDDVRRIESETFDVIFMFQVLEHMDRLDEHLAKLAQLARRDLFVSVPNGRRIEFNERHGGLLDMPPNHVGRWTPAAVEAAWARHGFSILEMERQPGDLFELMKTDVTYRILRLAHTPGSVANRVRSLPRGTRRQALQVLLAAALAPARLPTWIDGARSLGQLGDALWIHLRSPQAT